MKVNIGDNIVRHTCDDDAPESSRLVYRTDKKCIDDNGKLHYLYATDYRVLTLEAEEQFELLTEEINDLKQQRRAVFEGLERAE